MCGFLKIATHAADRMLVSWAVDEKLNANDEENCETIIICKRLTRT